MSTATIAKPSLREVILDAWQLYRRSQQIPFPADPGPLIRAQSRLWHQVEAFTRTDDRNLFAEPDTEAIDDAIDELVAVVEWHCGDAAATFVAGDVEMAALVGGEGEGQ